MALIIATCRKSSQCRIHLNKSSSLQCEESPTLQSCAHTEYSEYISLQGQLLWSVQEALQGTMKKTTNRDRTPKQCALYVNKLEHHLQQLTQGIVITSWLLAEKDNSIRVLFFLRVYIIKYFKGCRQ